MAVRKIIRMGHPALRQPAREVAPEDVGSAAMHRLVADMIDTLHDYGGIGLAAPQINEGIRLAIIEIPGGPTRYGELRQQPLTVCINPGIEILDAETEGHWEGCLSVPGLRGFVERPRGIRVAYTNLRGERESLAAEGFLATVFQHEFDHLDGKLYIDHIADPEKLVFEEEYVRYVLPLGRAASEVTRQDELKRRVAAAALERLAPLLSPGCVVGIGTGSTTNCFIDLLADVGGRIGAAVSSSVASSERLAGHGIDVIDLNEADSLVAYVDGADEVARDNALIKGGGGAHTREKIVAAAADHFICIVDESKLVDKLGTFPLPGGSDPLGPQLGRPPSARTRRRSTPSCGFHHGQRQRRPRRAWPVARRPGVLGSARQQHSRRRGKRHFRREPTADGPCRDRIGRDPTRVACPDSSRRSDPVPA